MGESRHALIIANDAYEDQGLKKLRAPGHDADALSGVLRDPEIGDFEVDVLRNGSAQDMRTRIEDFFKKRRRDDTLVVHLSCHGIKDESGELYFAARDTRLGLLEATTTPAYFVHRCMSRTLAGCTVLFLDCCYAGAFSRGASMKASRDIHILDAFPGERQSGGRGWAVITASNSMEYAFEGTELTDDNAAGPSVFTHAVVEGLETGDADIDADGEISLDDLYKYVHQHVTDQNPNQTPSKTAEMQGSMQVAHSRHRRIKIEAEPIPRPVQEALRSRNDFTRRGAVRELRARMKSQNLCIAEGARQTLETVARDDTVQVAYEAQHALDDARLTPSPARLDFGRVERGAAVPQQSVTLQGVPLARRCVAHATGKWLRVEESADGLAVGVDTSTEGRLSGDIALKGVADDAVVHVEAEVVPPPPEKPPDKKPTGSEVKEPGLTHRPESRLLLAPALAAAALALAVTSVITWIVAVVATVYAEEGLRVGPEETFAQSARHHGVIPALITALITATAALVLGAFARRDLSARRKRYTPGAKSATRSMASAAKHCAVPVLVLTVLMSIAYNIVTKHL
ncbi:caspase domain-containing protein [Streptomyces sp. NPDC085866]|uniref:caspase domain-containing protein n=1 Tax=Streptomyces sp. NPDC085866 TaxID=3365736 RepID=UPI0037D6F943